MLANEIYANLRTTRRGTSSSAVHFNRSDIIEFLKYKISTLVKEYNLEDEFDFKIDFLFDTISNLVERRNMKLKVQCLNPLGFILGFAVLQQETKSVAYTIDMGPIDKLQTKFQTMLNNEQLEIEDVIRYARYWIAFILKQDGV